MFEVRDESKPLEIKVVDWYGSTEISHQIYLRDHKDYLSHDNDVYMLDGKFFRRKLH